MFRDIASLMGATGRLSSWHPSRMIFRSRAVWLNKQCWLKHQVFAPREIVAVGGHRFAGRSHRSVIIPRKGMEVLKRQAAAERERLLMKKKVPSIVSLIGTKT